MKSSDRRTYSRLFLGGWLPVLFLLALPIARFPDISAWQFGGIVLLIGVAYLACVFAERGFHHDPPAQASSRELKRYLRATVMFSLISLIGCQLVLRDQSTFIGAGDYENLQEKYIVLTESSLEGTAVNSIFSTIGNLLRAFFFVAITSFITYSKYEKRILRILLVGALFAYAASQNFLVYVSRVQLIFYIVCACVAISIQRHPLASKKVPAIALVTIIATFLMFTTNQRFEAKFGDSGIAEDYLSNFFRIQVLPLGTQVLDQMGVAAFTLSMYLSQSVPEALRLMMQNDSPYALGGHSLYLIFSPLSKIVGIELSPPTPMTNQGMWWGYLGDMYIDFGYLFPVAYVASLYALVRAAVRLGNGPVFGLAFRCLIGAVIVFSPFVSVLNTFCVSVAALLLLAGFETRKKLPRTRKARDAARVNQLISTPSDTLS